MPSSASSSPSPQPQSSFYLPATSYVGTLNTHIVDRSTNTRQGVIVPVTSIQESTRVIMALLGHSLSPTTIMPNLQRPLEPCTVTCIALISTVLPVLHIEDDF